MTATKAATAPAPVTDLSSLDEALQGDDRPIVPVTVPDWLDAAGRPRIFLMRGMTGTHRDAWSAQQVVRKEKGASTEVLLANFRADLIVRSLVNTEGDPLVPAGQRERYREALGTRSSAAIQVLFKAAQKLSGLDDADVKEMTEELKDDPSDASGSN